MNLKDLIVSILRENGPLSIEAIYAELKKHSIPPTEIEDVQKTANDMFGFEIKDIYRDDTGKTPDEPYNYFRHWLYHIEMIERN